MNKLALALFTVMATNMTYAVETLSILLNSPVEYSGTGFFVSANEEQQHQTKTEQTVSAKESNQWQREVMVKTIERFERNISQQTDWELASHADTFGFTKAELDSKTAIQLKNAYFKHRSDADEEKFLTMLCEESSSFAQNSSIGTTGNPYLHFEIKFINKTNRVFNYDGKSSFPVRVRINGGTAMMNGSLPEKAFSVPAYATTTVPVTWKIEAVRFREEYDNLRGLYGEKWVEHMQVEIDSGSVPLKDEQQQYGINYSRESAYTEVNVLFGDATQYFPFRVRVYGEAKKKNSLKDCLSAISQFLDRNYRDVPTDFFKIEAGKGLSEVYERPFGVIVEDLCGGDGKMIVMRKDGVPFAKVSDADLQLPPADWVRKVSISFEQLSINAVVENPADVNEAVRREVCEQLEKLYDKRASLWIVHALVKLYEFDARVDLKEKWVKKLPHDKAKDPNAEGLYFVRPERMRIPRGVLSGAIAEKGVQASLVDSYLYLEVLRNEEVCWRTAGICVAKDDRQDEFLFDPTNQLSSFALQWRPGDVFSICVYVAEGEAFVRSSNAGAGGVAGMLTGAAVGGTTAGLLTGGLGAPGGALVGGVIGFLGGAGAAQIVPVKGARSIVRFEVDRKKFINGDLKCRVVSRDDGRDLGEAKLQLNVREMVNEVCDGGLELQQKYLVRLTNVRLGRGAVDGKPYYMEIKMEGEKNPIVLDLGRLNANVDNPRGEFLILRNVGGSVNICIKRKIRCWPDPVVFEAVQGGIGGSGWIFMRTLADKGESGANVTFKTFQIVE